jgi:hypothetical protein
LDDGTAFATLAAALVKFLDDPSLAGERGLLGPLYAAAEARLLGAAGGLERGRDAFERAVSDLSEAGVDSVGPRVVLARSYRELGERLALLCHAALRNAFALEPEGMALERTTPALRGSAQRLAVLLLAVSVHETAPRRLVHLAKETTRRVLVGESSLEPWQVLLRLTFARPPWVAPDEAGRADPLADPRRAVRSVLDSLLARADDLPQAFRTPTDDQVRRAIAMMRTLKIRPERPGGGWVTPFGAAKRFAQCFDSDTFPRKETEARPRPRGRSSAKNRAPK